MKLYRPDTSSIMKVHNVCMLSESHFLLYGLCLQEQECVVQPYECLISKKHRDSLAPLANYFNNFEHHALVLLMTAQQAFPINTGCAVLVEVLKFHLGYLPLPSAIEYKMAQCDFIQSPQSWSDLSGISILKELHFPNASFMEGHGHFDISICWDKVHFIALSLGIMFCAHGWRYGLASSLQTTVETLLHVLLFCCGHTLEHFISVGVHIS